MIYDNLKNASLYYSLHPRIAQGLQYLQRIQGQPFEEKREVIDGELLFAIHQEYESRPEEKGKWESHYRYVDIQYIVSGQERMDVLHIDALGTPHTEEAGRDVKFYNAPASMQGGATLHAAAGTFAIFFTHDGHRPSVQTVQGQPEHVRKIVLKVEL